MDYDFNEDKDEKEEDFASKIDIDEYEDLKKLIRDQSRELRNIKKEIREMKYQIGSNHPKKRQQRTNRAKIHRHSSRIEDPRAHIGSTIENYIGSILDSVGEAIDRSVGSLFNTTDTNYRGKYQKHEQYVNEEDLDEFYENGSKIMSALSDPNRLRLLKILEKEPLRQSDLAKMTGIKGGNFKHHIKILVEQNLVRQERVRERYMLTFAGREALKLAELLFIRGKRRLQVPVIVTDDDIDDSEEE